MVCVMLCDVLLALLSKEEEFKWMHSTHIEEIQEEHIKEIIHHVSSYPSQLSTILKHTSISTEYAPGEPTVTTKT